jgi:hypothetical protein
MAAHVSSSSFTPYPVIEKTEVAKRLERTQEFANEIARTDLNEENVEAFFSEDAKFFFNQKLMTRDEFNNIILEVFKKSMTEINQWQDTFYPVETDENKIVWTFQCIGKFDTSKISTSLTTGGAPCGIAESGYKLLDYSMLLEFDNSNASETDSSQAQENEQKHIPLKIRKIQVIEADLRQFSENSPLPPTQMTVRLLAYRSFQIPQPSDKLCELYDPKAVIKYPDQPKLSLEDFKKRMETSNTYNVVRTLKVHNEFTHFSNGDDIDGIEWYTVVYQERLGRGFQEDGIPGIYKIIQTAIITLGKDGKILEQNNISYTKTREAAPPDRRAPRPPCMIL